MNFKMTRPAKEWVTTPEAEQLLGIKRDRLKRSFSYPTSEEGFLKEGIHWKRGPFDNSPITWNVPQCVKALEAKGFTFTTEEQG